MKYALIRALRNKRLNEHILKVYDEYYKEELALLVTELFEIVWDFLDTKDYDECMETIIDEFDYKLNKLKER